MKKILTLMSIAFLVLSMFWLIAPEATVSAGSTVLDPDASVPELAWALGDPYPVVNEHVIFPAAPAYNIHWWAGGVYPSQSPTQNARTAYMSIRVPYSAPKSDEFYYVLLSAWDSNGSYNQLGFSNTYGTWGLTYSWTTRTTAGKLVYHYTSNAMAVSLGVTYTFYITTDNGVTHFVAKQGSVQVWSLDTSTGGNYLVLNNTYSPYGLDYTVYEEIWTISTFGGAPDFDFYFFNNYWVSTNGVTNAATWIDFFTTGAPNNVDMVISGNSVLVDNPKATILFQTNPSAGTITFGLGGVGPTYVNGQSVNSIADSDPLSMFPYSATANAPSGYGFDHWEYSGSSDRGVYVPDINSNPTTIEVNGDGWLKAVFSVDSTPPMISVVTPREAPPEALQDGVTLNATVSDPSGVDWVKFSIRETDGSTIDPSYESMSPIHVSGDTWQKSFNTYVPKLPDGNYLFIVNASDTLGNKGSKTVLFSIRNWASLKLLPATRSNKAGRTMPIKFSLRVYETVDPAMPFVYNEQLTIKIYQKGYPNKILQTSTYGKGSTNYRIDVTSEKYITNFKTLRTPATYVVEIYRKGMLIGSFEFKTVK